jgi:hypothetical protein
MNIKQKFAPSHLTFKWGLLFVLATVILGFALPKFATFAAGGKSDSKNTEKPLGPATNNALEFTTSSGTYVTFGDPAKLDLATFTIETWFKRTGVGTPNTTGTGGITIVPLLTHGAPEADNSNLDANWILGINTSGNVIAADLEANPGGQNYPISGTTPITDNVWHHAAATYDGTTWRLYLDGNLENTSSPGVAPRSDSLQKVALGTMIRSNGTTAVGYFEGVIDEARVWNVARTEPEILASKNLELTSGSGLVARWGLNEGTGTFVGDSLSTPADGTIVGSNFSWVSGFVPPPPTTTVMLQDGVNGYTGTRDTYTYDVSPGTVRGSETTMVQDKNPTDDRLSLLSFDLSSVPANAMITSASLDFYVDTEGQGFNMHRMKVPWDEATVTFTSIGNRHFAADDVDAEAAVDANWPGVDTYVGPITVPVPASTIKDWIDGTMTNNGWLMIATDVDDGQQLRTREHPTVADRPKLSVTYTLIPGTLEGGQTTTPATVNLTTEGTNDWTHWGLTDVTSFNRKNSVTPQISNYTQIGATAPARYFDNPTGYTWTDGTPTASAANSTTGIYISGVGNGFQLTVPADTNLKTLKLYLGVFQATGRLEATLSDGSAAPFVDTSLANPTGISNGEFAINYKAGAAGQTLTINWTADSVDSGLGNVTLQAAALADGPAMNNAPTVDAGTDQSITLPAMANLTGTASDDGLPSPPGAFTTNWTKVSGPGTVTFGDATALSTTATFSQSGVYTLRLTADDSVLTTTDDIVITVNPVPGEAALDFGGTNAYVNFGNPAKLHLSTFTVETRFRRDGNGATTSTGNGGVVNAIPLVTRGRGEAENANADTNFFLGIDDSTDVLAADFEEGATGSSPSQNHPVLGTTVITNNEWHHAAATYDGTKWQLFLDGVLEAELVVNEPANAAGNQLAAIASALQTNGAAGGFFDGAIDEVRIWDTALTGAQIRTNANLAITSATNLVARWGLNEGSGTAIGDSTANPADGTVTGANWTWVGGSPVINLAPLVNAGMDQSITLPATANLTGTASDDGLPSSPGTLTTTWSKFSGPGTVTFGNANSLNTTASFSVEGTYVLRLTGDDGGTTRTDDVTITVTSNTSMVMFQDGVNGYTGTRDTYTYDVSPGTVRGSETTMVQDKNPTDDRLSLLSFDLSSIPANATITSASLDFYVDTEGQGFNMHRMKVAWDEATTTFTSIGNRHYAADDVDAEAAVDANWPGVDTYVGPITVPVQTSTIKDWIDGTMTNNGWLMIATDPADGQQLRTREHPTVAHRPKLSVTYTTGNTAPAVPTLISPADAATGVSKNPSLSVNVSDPDGDPLTVTYYGREVTAAAPNFTIVALPDTQFYSSELNGGTGAMFQAQTQWIVNQRASRNIVFVTQLGDCVQNGDNGGDPVEWNRADAAFSLLENPVTTTLADGIPYGIAVGNHDQSPIGNPNGTTNFYNQYFGTSRFTGRAYYGGQYGSNNDNHYQLFSASGMDFIIIHLEYDTAANPAVLTWADNLLQTYSTRRAIVVSHHIVNTGNPGSFSSQGQATYDALKGNSNLFLMLNGHVAGEGRRQDTFNGNTVNSLLADYQSRSNGGDGWLRIMTFSPTNNEIQVETFSPTRNGGAGEFETDANSQFTLNYDMTGSSFSVIGTNNSVSGPTTDSINWSGLNNSTKYEWYVTVSDGTLTTTSPVWSFDTISLESDVAGRSTGDGSYLANDVQQVERFLTFADAIDTTTNEFQRADSAPYATRGNGIIDAADAQLAENYLIFAVSPQEAGGPTVPALALREKSLLDREKSILNNGLENYKGIDSMEDLNALSGINSLKRDTPAQLLPRVIRVLDNTSSAGASVAIDIEVDAEGDETGYSFTLDYDHTKLSNPIASIGPNGGTIQSVNNPLGLPGKKTFSVRNFPTTQYPAGNNQLLVRVTFDISVSATPGPTAITFSGNPTPNSVTDAGANTLAATFTGGTLTILAPTAAGVTVSGRVLNKGGRAVPRSIVEMRDVNGVVRTARTNMFGYYRFEDVTVGEIYIFNVFAKGYQFTEQPVEINDTITNQNFYLY